MKDPANGNLVDPDTGAVIDGGNMVTGPNGEEVSGIGEPPEDNNPSDDDDFGI